MNVSEQLSVGSASGIYQIRNKLNGKIYVGSAARFSNRWWLHRKNLKGNCHCNPHLQNAWNKNGEDVFEFSVLELVGDKTNLVKREQAWINSLNPDYNILKVAGSCAGRKWTEYQRSSFVTQMKGRVHSAETRAKISATKKAQGYSGPIFTDSIRTKISEAMKGNKNGRGKLGKIGYRHTEDAKMRMSLARKGRILSPEHCAAISSAKKLSPSGFAKKD